MTIKDLQEQLRLAKNKEAKVLFRVGEEIVDLELMAEVVSDGNNVHFPMLGETANSLVIKLKSKKVVGESE